MVWPTGNDRRRALVRRAAREIVIALAVVAAVAALGAPLGPLWRALSPRVELIRAATGWFPVQEEPEGYIAGDGWFAVITAAAGVLVALLAWWLLRRYRGPVIVVALAAGSLLGALFARWIGHEIGLEEYLRQVREATVGTRVSRQVNLRVQIVVLVQPLFAVAAYTLLAAFHYEPSLNAWRDQGQRRLDQVPAGMDVTYQPVVLRGDDPRAAQVSAAPAGDDLAGDRREEPTA